MSLHNPDSAASPHDPSSLADSPALGPVTLTNETGKPGQSPASASPMTDAQRRREQLERERAESLGLIRPIGVVGPDHRPGNARRVPLTKRHFFGLLFTMIVLQALLAGFIISFYQANILPRLTTQPPLPTSRPTASGSSDGAATLEMTSQLASNSTELVEATRQIAELQKQIDAMRKSASEATSRVDLMEERLSNTITAVANIPSAGPAGSAPAGVPVAAAMLAPSSAVSQELVILKERNRLTDWADQAIAEGSAEASGSLWRHLRDPEMAKLKHAAAAEIIRVQSHYARSSRVPADYRLPIRELFHDMLVTAEADLTLNQLMELLNQAQDFRVRTRAAYILGSRKEPEVGDALIRAMKVDPTLDVIRECQLSMEQAFGMPSSKAADKGIQLFDITSAEAWWRERSAALATEASKAKDSASKAAPASKKAP